MNPSNPTTRVVVYLGEVVGYVIGNDKSLVYHRAARMRADFLEVINSSPDPERLERPPGPTISLITTHPPLNHEEQQSLDNGLVVVI